MVSLFQMVLVGTPLARVGSTGVSATAHLHFEMHDALCEQRNGALDPLGASIKPSPMGVGENGLPQLLRLDDNGKCVHSNNTPSFGPVLIAG